MIAIKSIPIMVDIFKDYIVKMLENDKFLPRTEYSDEENVLIIGKITIIFLAILLFYNIDIFLKVGGIIILVVIVILFLKALNTIPTIPTLKDNTTTKKTSISDKKNSNDDNISMNISFLDNVTTNDGISVLSNISLCSKGGITESDSDYDKLFYDTNRVFEGQVASRNSVKDITYDLGNTVEFAKALSSPYTTCKEDNLKCLEYEDLKYKR